MKYQVLFPLKNSEKLLEMSSAAVVIGALRVNRDLILICRASTGAL